MTPLLARFSKNILLPFFELLRKIGTHRRYQVAFGLSFGGLIMITASHVLEGNEIGSHLIWTILLEVGIACIIAAIAEFILLKHMGEIFKQEVEDMKTLLAQVSETFRQEVRHDMKILSHCLEHELVDVMPPRNREQENLAFQEIKSAIENARGEVCIIVFTLRDILNSLTSLEDPLRNLLERNRHVAVKLLLIDPTSDAAHIRVMVEEGSQTQFEKSNLHSALRANFYAVQDMITIAESKDKFKIEALFYNILPNFYMVSTPNEVFIEPYHLGHKTGADSTIGGIVPLLRFSSKSPMYESAQSHFSYIWKSFENGKAPLRPGQPENGYIRVKTMDEVNKEIERRLGGSERRGKASEVNTERRSASDRRERRNMKVRSAAG